MVPFIKITMYDQTVITFIVTKNQAHKLTTSGYYSWSTDKNHVVYVSLKFDNITSNASMLVLNEFQL